MTSPSLKTESLADLYLQARDRSPSNPLFPHRVSGSTQYILPRLKDAGSHFVESIIRVGKDTAAVIQFEGEATLLKV